LVTLSWLQPVAVVAGGTGLAALQFVLGGERPGGRRLALVLALLLVAVLGLRFSPVAPALAESFEWAAAGGEFMRFVRESQALYDDPSALLKHLGGAILLLPFALIAALTVSMRTGRTDLAPWIACAPPLLLLALAQRRFAEAAVLPTVVLLGWGASAALRRWRTTSALPVLPVGGLLFLLALASNAETSWRTIHGLERWGSIAETPERAAYRGQRRALAWLDRHAPPIDAQRPQYSVLAQWDDGHLIEWVGRRPSVASNFGLYLGRESYLAPWRFLLCEDEGEGERQLEARGVRYLYLTADARLNLATMVSVLHPGEEADFLPRLGGRRWMRSLGARLISDGGGSVRVEEGPGVAFLRLVHVSAGVDPTEWGPRGPVPAAWIYERVPGARVEIEGEPGQLLAVALHVDYRAARHALIWRASAVVDGAGRAGLRVPYATDAPNGDGRVDGGLRWSLGERSGRAEVPESMVLAGDRLGL
jgi:hypothetical protein